MRALLKTVISLLLLYGMAQAAAFEKVAKSRTAKALISSEKPLVVGVNTIKIALDKKYAGSEVSVKVFMPAMPGMPYMEDKSVAKPLDQQTYETKINLSMGGTWQIHIFVTPKEGKKIRLKSALSI